MNATMFMLKASFLQHVIKGNVVQSQYFCQAPVNGKMDSTQRSECIASYLTLTLLSLMVCLTCSIKTRYCSIEAKLKK